MPTPNDLLPAPFHSVNRILGSLEDAVSSSKEEMVILLASHSIGTQYTIQDRSVDASVSAISKT